MIAHKLNVIINAAQINIYAIMYHFRAFFKNLIKSFILMNFAAKIVKLSNNRRFVFGGRLLSYDVYLKQGLLYPLFHFWKKRITRRTLILVRVFELKTVKITKITKIT